MNIAHINSKAGAGGQVRRSSLVRRLLACALIGGAAMSMAHAGAGQGDPRGQRQEYSRDADPRQQQRQNDERQQRQNDERQARAEEQRRDIEQQQANEGRRNGGRMTPDERRDLRRQINEAGADIYPNQRRRR